jgi:hypothetical protein
VSEGPVETWVYVRSTVNMAGLGRGEETWINAELPRFEPLLRERYLKPVDPPMWELPPDQWTDDERADWGLPPLGDPPPDGIDS